MSASVECGNCGRRYAVAESVLGRRVKCKGCGTAFVAERPGTGVTVGAAAVTGATTSAESEDDYQIPFAPTSEVERPSLRDEAPSAGPPELPSYAPPAPPAARLAPPPPPGFLPAAARAAPPPPAAGFNAPPIGYARPPAPRDERSVRETDAGGLHPASSLLVLSYVLVSVAAIIFVIAKLPDQMPREASSLLTTILWVHGIGSLIGFGVAIAPACMFGVILTSKICRFEMPDSAYARAAGVAAVPLLAHHLIGFIGPSVGSVLLGLAIALPGAWFVLKWTHRLTVVESLVGIVLTAVLFCVGSVVSGLVVVMVTTGVAKGMIDPDARGRSFRSEMDRELTRFVASLPWGARFPDREEPGERKRTNATPEDSTTAYNAPNPSTDYPSASQSPSSSSGYRPGPVTARPPAYVPPAPPPVDPAIVAAEAEVTSIRSELNAVTESSAAISGPEDGLAKLEEVRRRLAAARPAHPSRAFDWSRLEAEVSTRRQQLSAMPPRTPPKSVFDAPAAAGTLLSADPANGSGARLGEEVSFAGLRFRPPVTAKLDLRRDPADGKLEYAFTGPQVSLVVVVEPRMHPRQKRVFLKVRPYQQEDAEGQRLFTLDATSGDPPSEGRVNGIDFARARDTNGIHYAAPVAAGWLHVTIRAPAGARGDDLSACEAAVRTFRPERPGDRPADPFAADALAARFGDEPDAVAPFFRRHPEQAEPHVVRHLSHASQPARRAAADLLATVATGKSVAALMPLTRSDDADVAAAVRAVLKRLAPDKFDDVADFMLGAADKDAAKRREAIEGLGRTRVDPKRRAAIATLLEDVLIDRNGDAAVQESAGRALQTWAAEKTTLRLAPELNNPDLPDNRRDALMSALSGTRDRAAAAVILKWIAKAPDQTRAAITRMGPAAEDETVKVFTALFMNKTPDGVTARKTCVQILSEIGTIRSLEILGRSTRDPRDPPTQEAAKLAIEAVKARVAAAKPATKPA